MGESDLGSLFFCIHLLWHSFNYSLHLLFSCFPYRLDFDSDESLDDDEEEEAEKERSLGNVASPIEQTEEKSSHCSPSEKKGKLSNDSPTALDVENADVDKLATTDTDETVIKKDCLEDSKQEEKSANENEVKQKTPILDDVRSNFLFRVILCILLFEKILLSP